MSDFSAIRGVTISLQRLLEDNLTTAPPAGDGLSVTVTISRPDVDQPGIDGSRLNLYLYHVLENYCLANQEDPRTGTNRDYGRPPLSLNLRYLITPFARDTDETEAHRVLGAAMQVLHENAILTPALNTAAGRTALDTSLLGALEHPRISLLPTTLDDLSKIWSGAENTMRLSAAYEVTVVQIEPTEPRITPLPVRERNVIVTLSGPRISAVEPDIAGIGDTVVIHGSGFLSATTRVLLGEAVQVDLSGLGPPALTGSQIQIAIPNDPSLQPGPLSLRVETGFDAANAVATGAFPGSVRSEPVPMVLVPKISSINPTTVVAGSGAMVLTVNGQRLYRAADAANITLLVAGQTVPAVAFTTATPTQIAATVTAPLLPGQYPVHVRYNAVVSLDDVRLAVTP